MKYIVVIGDGMPDLKEPRGSTPLQVARHPNMDEIASRGVVGALSPIPEGMEPGSEVAIMGIMGYDPLKYYTGRGAIEAAGIGINLSEEELAFRLNLVTEGGGVLTDYTGGRIGTDEAKDLIEFLKTFFRNLSIKLYVGISYRHLLILKGGFSEHIECKPPHEVVGMCIEDVMVKPTHREGIATAEFLNNLMLKSRQLLGNHPVNLSRVKRGLRPANMIWPWGFGRRPYMPPFQSIYGVEGGVVSAVNLIKGIGRLAQMKIIEVPGATGYIDTNFEGKAEYALKGLDEGLDIVFIHVEAPDEAGHEGSFDLKVKAIEYLDTRLIGRLLDRVEGDTVIAIVSDHLTPVSVGRHVRGLVPYAFCKVGEPIKDRRKFDEGLAEGAPALDGPSLLKAILKLH